MSLLFASLERKTDIEQTAPLKDSLHNSVKTKEEGEEQSYLTQNGINAQLN